MKEYIVEFGDRPINDDNEFIHEHIVRCRDCKFFIPSGYCGEMHHKALADGFCSWGERR